jgi:hypothetical protein
VSAFFASGIPTLRPVISGAQRTARRFPFVLAAGILAAFAAILLMEDLGSERLNQRLLVAATLGLPLFLALRMIGERRRVGDITQALLGLGAVLVLAVVGALWWRWSEPVQFARYVQLSAAFHLLAAIAPMTREPDSRAFWEYNRMLFERVLTAAVYTAVLFAGLALALAAVDQLFGVDVSETAYARLWVTIVFVGGTWILLGGVPDLEQLERAAEYPAGLKVFAQYILMPIVAVYLVILTLYFGKVLGTWEWPSGWIGWLVTGVTVTGIFALLLVHPVSQETGNRWVVAYARGFFAALLPSVVMLWLAIGQRVGQYGITERRYFLIVLSAWLAAIAVQQLVTRSRGIAVIPVTLCAVAIATLAGPWGAYRVSERSQVGRLAGLLERNGRLVEGRARSSTAEVPEADRREISATLRYLAETHGTGAIAPWFEGRLAEIDTAAEGTEPSDRGEARARTISAWLGVSYVGWSPERYLWFSYVADAREPERLAGYDELLPVRYPSPASTGSGLTARAERSGKSLALYRGTERLLEMPLDSLLEALKGRPRERATTPVPARLLRVERAAPGLSASLRLLSVSGHWTADSLVVSQYTAVLLTGAR